MTSSQPSGDNIKLALIVGHHPFDVPALYDVFYRMPGVDTYPQAMDTFGSSAPEVRRSYDCVAFYNMHLQTPAEGQPFGPQIAGAILDLTQLGTGVVVLHHALLAYRDWPLWDEIVGISQRTFGYYPNETVRVHVADKSHAITAGLSDWEMTDETYTMPEPGEDSHVLLTTDNPNSMSSLAWTRQVGQARVLCFESGHDNLTYVDPSFREVLRRGILWAAGRE